MVTPPSQRRVCGAFAGLSVTHPMFAGCAAAISIGNSKHANATHAARTITLMTASVHAYREREPKPGISQARQNGPIAPICDDLFLLSGCCRTSHVVPANAGTHNRRWLLFGELLPQVA